MEKKKERRNGNAWFWLPGKQGLSREPLVLTSGVISSFRTIVITTINYEKENSLDLYLVLTQDSFRVQDK